MKAKGTKRSYRRRIAIFAATMALMLGAGGAGWTESVSAEQASLSASHWAPDKLKAPFVQPAWSLAVDAEQSAIAEDGKVFAFAGKKLVALDAATGKKLWTSGSELKPVLAYAQGVLYGQTADGRVYAVNSKNGGRIWLSAAAMPEAMSIKRIADTLYVLEPSRTIALEPGSGKQRWAAEEPMSSMGIDDIIEADGVVIRSFLVQGALTSVQIDGFDKRTGEKLWGIFRQGMPLAVKDGVLYSITDEYFMADSDGTPDRSLSVGVFNVKTGVKKGERVYNWKLPGEPPYRDRGSHAFLDGGDFYVYQGDVIAKYDFWAYKPGDAPAQKWNGMGSNARPLDAILNGRMLFQDGQTGHLKGFKLAGGQQVAWVGDNPAAQLDLYGKGLYVGQSDGVLHAIDFMTHQPAFSVKTGARTYGPTLKTGAALIIQAEGKLLGVKLPASLQ